MKQKKCRVCREPFTPRSSMQTACSPDCALSLVQKEREKLERVKALDQRRADKERKLELMPIQHFLKRAEKAVNAFVRERDKDKPCISCGTYDAIEFHAGHFIPVGRSSSIRYDPANIHRQCSHCNVFKGGNLTEYEARLTARIGESEVDRLKNAPRLKVWTRDELLSIEAEFKEKLKELKHD